MKFDLMVGSMSWAQSAEMAKALESAGFGGMLFTEAGQTPWMSIAAAATAAPTLEFSTGIAVAFPRSPMISAQIAWELAANTQGRFRLGLGSQVKGHVVRRYSSTFDKPAPQMRDYVAAFKASMRAFRGEEKWHRRSDRRSGRRAADCRESVCQRRRECRGGQTDFGNDAGRKVGRYAW